MKERFIRIKKGVGDKVVDLLRIALNAPPSYEEVYLNFKHGKNCSGKENLVAYSVPVALSGYDPSAMGNMNQVIAELKFLECPECHRSARYSG